MRITANDRDRVYKVCLHELGHFLTARENGFKTNGLSFTFSPFRGHGGAAGLEPNRPGVKTIDDIINLLESRMMVLYAGVVAESTDVDGKCDQNYAQNQWKSEGGAHDHVKINELALVLRSILHPATGDNETIQKELTVIDARLFSKSSNFVIKKIKLFHDVADHLSSKIANYNHTYTFSDIEIDDILEPFISNS